MCLCLKDSPLPRETPSVSQWAALKWVLSKQWCVLLCMHKSNLVLLSPRCQKQPQTSSRENLPQFLCHQHSHFSRAQQWWEAALVCLGQQPWDSSQGLHVQQCHVQNLGHHPTLAHIFWERHLQGSGLHRNDRFHWGGRLLSNTLSISFRRSFHGWAHVRIEIPFFLQAKRGFLAACTCLFPVMYIILFGRLQCDFVSEIIQFFPDQKNVL